MNSQNKPASVEAHTPEAAHQLLHELQVHQIELEMQNDELRQAQAELCASQARYFDLYDLAPVGYCSLNDQGLILEANLTGATLLGMSRQALIQQPVFRYILKADQDIYYLHRRQLLETGEAQSCELRMVKHDGTPFWAHLAATRAQDADGTPVQRLVLSDISDRKRMEEALHTKNLELEQARQTADKANLAKSEFLSSMSHELRSPLNAILGFAQLMESGPPLPTPTQKASIDQILHGGWYLLELINEILDLALIESGKLSLSLEPISLSEVLLDCQAMFEPQAHQSGIRIDFSRLNGTCLVNADRTRVKQVLVNLLSNAIKYNRVDGTVHVTCSAATEQRLRISVQDSGHGLDPEMITKLFQPFNRLGQETSTKEGTGIGLAVSKRLIELMGGDIGVQSAVGVGSVFWFELNLAGARLAAAAADETPAPVAARSQSVQ